MTHILCKMTNYYYYFYYCWIYTAPFVKRYWKALCKKSKSKRTQGGIGQKLCTKCCNIGLHVFLESSVEQICFLRFFLGTLSDVLSFTVGRSSFQSRGPHTIKLRYPRFELSTRDWQVNAILRTWPQTMSSALFVMEHFGSVFRDKWQQNVNELTMYTWTVQFQHLKVVGYCWYMMVKP